MKNSEREDKITLGISSCLLGQKVRFDSSHKHNRYITDTLGEYFEFVPYCPEVAIGLGIPRPTIRMVKIGDEVRVRGVKDPSQDVTESLKNYGEEVAPQCASFSGYLFKSKSPSCGMERVKIYSEKGDPMDTGAGVFADTIMRRHPSLPVEEEGRLMDSRLRENFIERVFIYHRWQQYMQGMTSAKLVEFHTRHKFTVLAHDEPAYRELGRLVSEAGSANLSELCERYIELLMQALKRLTTPRTHANVLQHMMGFIKEGMSREDKQELLEVIEEYRLGRIPLIVPITLLKHYLRLHPNDYIESQYYMNPHPRELMLRNHI
ncbi:MAG: DUF1722 domain-containing protein [Gammaproteobacteria bacterium]|nr:DUF1722 domain-containing protein [Gammaproteobacteria bacterium]